MHTALIASRQVAKASLGHSVYNFVGGKTHPFDTTLEEATQTSNKESIYLGGTKFWNMVTKIFTYFFCQFMFITRL